MICVLPSLIVITVGAYIQVAVQEQISLIEGFNGDVLPAFMIIFGFLGALVSLFSGKVCWTNRLCSKRFVWGKYLLPLVIVQILIAIFVFVSAIMCFIQISMLESSFDKGISSAMRSYKTDRAKKRELDVLQIGYRCCGVNAYTDWFHVSWIHEEYISEAKRTLLASFKSGDYLNDDVPFSCCIADVLRPCVHHHVHDNDMHYNYDYRTKVTLHGMGCKNALMEIYGRILTDVGALVLSISFLQMITLTIMRLLQTSVDASLENDDPREPSIGYLFPCSGKDAITAVKREVKTYHKKERTVMKGVPGDPTSMEPLLEEDGSNASVDTDQISLNSSFEDEGVYEGNLPPVEEENPYMTINSAEMLNFPEPPRYTSFSGTGNQAAAIGHYQSVQNGFDQNVMSSQIMVTDHPTNEYVMPSNDVMGTGQYEMASYHMVGADQGRESDMYLSPCRTHTYVNELPLEHGTQM